ncbi:hypothetical protein FOL46_003596 [Perkinsus olseni]|uniref:Uncharacterized protein n=1 Tax=Perkinsus olseni TaxID=32597 RepID=A0A7J6M1X7_PEROL|nr:hypothetical protein FOL46_003596 [Perkinsus olseni]
MSSSHSSGMHQYDQPERRSALSVILSIVARRISSPSVRSIPLYILAALGARWLYFAVKKYLRERNSLDWKKSCINEYTQIQACILTTEHLAELGRIEKRTVFCKDIKDFFGHDTYVINKVLEAAKKSTPEDPILTKFLSSDDKWHVLSTCTNHLSALFAPYHIFFNEARRCDSYYRSAWYAFTLTCGGSTGEGRFFVTPYKPVCRVDDVGSLRIRIILVNEEELREICTGQICPPTWGFFNARHECRWNLLKRFSELFERQLMNVSGDPTLRDWGANLCGRMSPLTKKKKGHEKSKPQATPNLQYKNAIQTAEPDKYEPEDNCFLRLHIPYPTAYRNADDSCSPDGRAMRKDSSLGKSKDVVLFE